MYVYPRATVGGLLANRWLRQPPPTELQLIAAPQLRKYFRQVEAWSRGSWALFQQLLEALHAPATRLGPEATIARVATRWVLDQPAVAGVILGARLGQGASGVERYVADKTAILDLQLNEAEAAEIDAVQRSGARLLDVYGDCGHDPPDR